MNKIASVVHIMEYVTLSYRNPINPAKPEYRNMCPKKFFLLIFTLINPGTPYVTYMSHVFFLHLLHEYNKKNYFKLSPTLL